MGIPSPNLPPSHSQQGRVAAGEPVLHFFLHKWLSRVLPLFLCCCASDTWRIAVYADLMLLKTQCFLMKVKI